MRATETDSYATATATAPFEPKPVGGSLLAGLVASACCGGSLLFAAIGLGAFYGSLGMYRYIPQALTLGTLSIVAINWLYYRRQAGRWNSAGLTGKHDGVRRAMLLSGTLGLLMMAVSFVLLTWLEHGVVKAAQFLSRPEYGQALLRGVPNQDLVYVALTFLGVPVLALLPLPRRPHESLANKAT
jgi:hypothetical protein